MAARRSRTRRQNGQVGAVRKTDYHNLRNPFEPACVFSDDQVLAIHETSLEVLETLGIRVLLDEACDLFHAAGAIVDRDSATVRIGRDIVEGALSTAPRRIDMRAGRRDKDIRLELGSLVFQPGAGAPHATDLVRGRRPGTLSDFRDLVKLTHFFDVLHMVPPLVEAQDVDTHLRHYAFMEATLTLSDKVPFLFSRGRAQVMDGLEMLRDFRGLSDEEFSAAPHIYTIVNSNSPRQLDMPMSQGLIDFARTGQMVIVTPFTLMGAMAPITPTAALALSHAEALAAITLTQIARAGAPVCYGSFTSNVDMKSGAPAFGTPEQVNAGLGAGQLARMLGLPWRSAAGSAANLNDVQAAHETEISAWGALLSGATVILHGAGWLEGGLTVSYEKLITDVEMLQVFAELCSGVPEETQEDMMAAIAEVGPGGHFFGSEHTMARYKTAFYEPLVADWSNFGTWTEAGERDANTRATSIWQNILENGDQPDVDEDRLVAMQAFIRKRTAEGGAPPES